MLLTKDCDLRTAPNPIYKKTYFLKKYTYLFIYLAVSGLRCSSQASLSLWRAGLFLSLVVVHGFQSTWAL